jgi:hypothetical protein
MVLPWKASGSEAGRGSFLKTMKRESGYYWVNYAGHWEIAWYYSGTRNWKIFPNYQGVYFDKDFNHIDEKQLKRTE